MSNAEVKHVGNGCLKILWPESENWSCDGEYLSMDEAADLVAKLQTEMGKAHTTPGRHRRATPKDMPKRWTTRAQ